MKIEQTWWTEANDWQPRRPGAIEDVQLVLAFARPAKVDRM